MTTMIPFYKYEIILEERNKLKFCNLPDCICRTCWSIAIEWYSVGMTAVCESAVLDY